MVRKHHCDCQVRKHHCDAVLCRRVIAGLVLPRAIPLLPVRIHFLRACCSRRTFACPPLSQSHHQKNILADLSDPLYLQLHLFLKQRLMNSMPLFQQLSADTLVQIMHRLVVHIAVPGEAVVVQGDIGDCMYFLVSGSALVTVSAAEVGEGAREGGGGEGKEKGKGKGKGKKAGGGGVGDLLSAPPDEHSVLAKLLPGSHFGEMALLNQLSRRTTSVVACSFCELERLPGEGFRWLLDQCPDL
jgi:CRP-like cAMP-binding protein